MKIIQIPFGESFPLIQKLNLSITPINQHSIPELIKKLDECGIPNTELLFPEGGSYVLIAIKKIESFDSKMSKYLGEILGKYAKKITVNFKRE